MYIGLLAFCGNLVRSRCEDRADGGLHLFRASREQFWELRIDITASSKGERV